MISRRRIRRTLLAPCLGFTLTIVLYFRDSVFESISPCPLPTPIFQTVTETVTSHETVTHWQQPVGGRTVKKSLQSHIFRPDGLLEVNPNGKHPIYDLTERAEAEWNKKLQRQSKTLDEAVAEYKRRYHRAPPKGFDDWWFYCEENDVQLPDEYDRIYQDLEPFWGVDPQDLRRIQRNRESHEDSFTIGKNNDLYGYEDEVRLLRISFQDSMSDPAVDDHIGQAGLILDTLEDVAKWIPPFRAVFSPHDNPNLATDWDLKTQALRAAASGTYIDVNNPLPVKHGWPSACSPKSALRQTTFNLDDPPAPPSEKTFIYDHIKAMDPCAHPSILHQHGQYLAMNEGPTPYQKLIPQFSYCSTGMFHDIIPATPINWVDDIPRDTDPDFLDKVDDRLHWRGTSTGMWHDHGMRWRGQQRTRIVKWANERNGTANVLRPTKTRNERVGEGDPTRRARLNPALMDVTFAGQPGGCSPSVCEIMKKEFVFREMQDRAEAGNYKYVLDVDGHGWSSRFKRLMVSRSLIFKSTAYPEWFQERIQPWVHYVPVKVDYSDLYDSLTFYRGGLNGEGAHEEMAAKIAHAGRDWSRAFWRWEDLTAYNFRLFLEYARVMNLDRESMSYEEWD